MNKRNHLTRLEARIAALRAELARSRAYYVAGDTRALNDSEYANKVVRLEELRAEAAALRVDLKESGRAFAKAENETFERRFMAVSKSRLPADKYRELIAATNESLGIQAAA